MRPHSILPFTSVGVFLAAAATAFAQPDPREIPVPPIPTALGHLPGVGDLPARPDLPDVLTMADGTRVTTPAQWSARRTEMRRILEYYAIGQMPPAPGNVKGRELKSETVLHGTVRYRLIHLTFGPEEKLALDIGVFTPADGGPFPAILYPGGTPPGGTVLPRLPQGPGQGHGLDALLPVAEIERQLAASESARRPDHAPGAVVPSFPGQEGAGPAAHVRTAVQRGGRAMFGAPLTAEMLAERHADVFRRGYALVMFNNNDCAEDTTLRMPDGSWAFRTTRFYPAYPGYDWGVLAGWAWGTSRIADYLETDPAIDPKKLIITGASRAGKSAMIAAAFDDRLMGAPVVTGGGGIGAYRFAGARHSETLEIMEKKYPNWFSPHLHEFWGHREKLPFDEHWFLALCAPRPFLALEGLQDTISLPEAVKASFDAARPAYALFHAEDRLGVNYAHHAHAFTEEDWTALMDFADLHLRGRKVDRTFDHFAVKD
ncbi:MAG TPA: hypothetical protein VHE61_15570 [Opitutaceae bacterium]|nr:hypothetical protein [Opitutaceae bacterium]